jgi:ABC-type Zn uptake system ZnuABC Zn-binding protein ZnuA
MQRPRPWAGAGAVYPQATLGCGVVKASPRWGFRSQLGVGAVAAVLLLSLAGCEVFGVGGGSVTSDTTVPGTSSGASVPVVLAAETFLADIAQNVAGARLRVEALMPVGVDPHSYEPTPADVAKVADSSVLIVNGAGFESFLERLLQNADGRRTVVEASAGLTSRGTRAGDPHFWLDPTLVATYVTNIQNALSTADPTGSATYAANAATYGAELADLDTWIRQKVAVIPVDRRLLVTNHESLGYFADRYGFRIVGAVVPSVSTDASPSAQQLAQLVNLIKSTGVRAIFLEQGADPRLAKQVAAETGAKVVTDLYTHSITEPGGVAPTYLDMMRVNVNAIVGALE